MPPETRPGSGHDDGPDPRWPAVAFGIALIAIVAVRFGQEMASHRPGFELPATAVAFHTIAGDTVRLADLRGDAVLVTFWEMRCEPCLAGMPVAQGLWDRYRESGLHVIGLSLDDEPVTQFANGLRERGVFYPLAPASPAAQRTLRFAGTLPTTVLLDRQGNVVEHIVGAVDGPTLEMAVLRALASPGS